MCRYLVALVVVLVAIWGAWRFNVHDQPSWKGATFGMFARVDNLSTRVARAYAIDVDGDEQRVPLPPDLSDEYERALALPTEGRVDALARRWSATADTDPPWSQFVVEILTLDFDADGPEVRLVPLREVRVTRTFA